MSDAHSNSEAVLQSLFPGQDETSALARSVRWTDTALGEPSGWSPELCAAVRTVMPSRIPMLLWWGDDLVQIYNQAYRGLVASKHPEAMGQPAAVCWAEVWDDLAPKVALVQQAGEASYDRELLLFVDRHGYLEETYWTFSYSPIRSADGDVIGIFVATSDVSLERVEARRLDTIRSLAVLSSGEFTSPPDAVTRVGEILATNRWAVPFAVVYLVDPSGDLVASTRYGVQVTNRELPERLAAASPNPVAAVARGREPTVVTFQPDELEAEPGPLGPQPPSAAYLLPLGAAGRDVEGVLVLGLNPYRRVDSRYTTFATLVARQLTALLTDVRGTAVERARSAALTELDRDKSVFFANVSHEFRTPVTVMLAATTELRRSALSVEQTAHVDAIERAGSRLDRLVDTLLEFARAEAGTLSPANESFDLAETTRDVLSMFRSAVEAADLELTVSIDDVGLVDGDREAWIKIVANLVSNAYKFTEHGSISVGLRRDGHTVTLTVADTGRGISSADAPRVFDRFHQVVGQPARGIAGTGIGLALVKDLVQAQDGTVDLASTPGLGTTLTVSLPVNPVVEGRGSVTVGDVARTVGPLTSELVMPPAAPRLEPAQRSPVRLDTDPLSAVPTDAHRAGVLLVEDNPDLRTYLTRLLTDDGWSVTAVADVGSALSVEHSPDIILSDVMLPGESGLDLVRLVRSHESWASIPVILLTARGGSAEVAQGLAAGADDYVRKPFEPTELLSRLRANHELAQERGKRARRAEEQAEHLHIAVTTNRQIGVAVGVLMSRHKVTSEQAFALLRQASNQSNRKLRDVAEQVTVTGQLPDTRPGRSSTQH